jgi:UDP-N-acetylglucosamine 1-carboxyvinyltransferase
MDKFVIKGPSVLKGKVLISGSKNAALPILASTLLFDKPVVIQNLPRVRDINTMLNLLRSLGSKIEFFDNRKKVRISKTKKPKHFASYSLLKTMRAGILVLGPLVAKYQKSIVSFPGGCVLNGNSGRPINLHLRALQKLGMKYEIKKGGYIYAKSKGKLKGKTIKFPSISVGATQHLLMSSVLSNGTTTLKGLAIEPEVVDLINFLNSAGANIKWIGKRTCQIIGVNSLKETNYTVMGDRIETGTFCVAATLTKGNLLIKGFDPSLIKTELDLLKKTGAKIKTIKDEIHIKGPQKIKKISNLVTKEYGGFPTDLAPQFMVLLCKANGRSSITENIFQSRFMHAMELQRLGAKILIKNNKATIEGNTNFIGAEVMSSDLRASAALILAGISAKGTTVVSRVYHCDRGYEKIENKLKKIGAKIRRLN